MIGRKYQVIGYIELRDTEISVLKAKLVVSEGQKERREDVQRCSNRLKFGCQCELHSYLKSTTSSGSFADWLGRNVGNVSEIEGAMYSRNLGNIAVELVKLILEWAGFQHLQVQSEGKSKACGVASMVKYIFGSEDNTCGGNPRLLCENHLSIPPQDSVPSD